MITTFEKGIKYILKSCSSTSSLYTPHLGETEANKKQKIKSIDAMKIGKSDLLNISPSAVIKK